MASDAFILPLGSEEPDVEEDTTPAAAAAAASEGDAIIGSTEGEDDNNPEKAIQETLQNFRQLWKEELNSNNTNKKQQRGGKNTYGEGGGGESSGINQDTAFREAQARSLFMEGVNSERRGQMMEAIQYYRHAMHLVPDIEFRISESSTSNTGSSNASNESSTVDNGNNVDGEDKDEEEEEALLSALTTNMLKSHCEPQYPTQDTHISALPVELLIILFRWVISSDLDLRALEQLSMVCRGFYVCSRDPELWRETCLKIFGRSCIMTKDYESWRQMYLERPHLQYNGVYISKSIYYRQGEPSVDNFYQPWHQVEYYRYVRVFSDGVMLMYNTPDEPQNVITKLRKLNCPLPGIMVGRYRTVSDVVTAVLHKENVKEYDPNLHRYRRKNRINNNQVPEAEQTFHVEFGIYGGLERINMKLEFNCYSCHTRYRSTSNTNTTEFDTDNFPPLYFSRVKSFNTTSHKPL